MKERKSSVEREPYIKKAHLLCKETTIADLNRENNFKKKEIRKEGKKNPSHISSKDLIIYRSVC